jgi:hypothetical protein
MGISSIEDVLDYTSDEKLRSILTKGKADHEALGEHLKKLLDSYHDDGKEPSAMAKGMSWLKTSMKMTMDSSDETVADLMVDGCNMGTKSLHKYLNQYSHATDKAKKLVEDVLKEEEGLAEKLREYL